MRSAESLGYNLTVPRLLIPVALLATVMTWAQTPRADLPGAQLGAAAEHLQQGKVEQTIRECKGVWRPIRAQRPRTCFWDWRISRRGRLP